MSTSRATYVLAAVLVVLLVMGAALPAVAAYTKLYRLQNGTGASQSSVQAVLNGLEIVDYSNANPRSWLPATVGYALIGGVYSSTITFGGPALPDSTTVGIGWTTADGSCRLRDLRWGDGTVPFPTQVLGVPGGGMVFYDWPNPGDLTVVITNDTEGVLDLLDVGFAVSGYELSLEELESIVGTDFVQLRVDSIDADIDVLRTEVQYYGANGDIPGPSANSLDRKLERAAAYKEAGLTEYLAGDLEKALFLWGKAAGHVANFISEVTAASQKGNLSLALYERWITGVAGGPATAPEIYAALLALPDGQALQSFPELTGPLPAYPGLGSMVRVPWPAAELYPGEYTAFVAPGMALGAGFIMGGSVLDGNGNVLLDWLEQGVAEPGVIDTEAPEFELVTATPEHLWPPDHSIVEMTLNVTVTDNSGYAVWYVADVTSNQPESGTGDGDTAPDWGTDPNDLQSVWLRSERSGNDPTGMREYTITLVAIDMAGNTSEYDLVVPVDHDMG